MSVGMHIVMLISIYEAQGSSTVFASSVLCVTSVRQHVFLKDELAWLI